jgi:hypothetical protein
MGMSTQVLDQASANLASLLIDQLQIMDVGEPVTTGTTVTRSVTPAGQPVNGLVQTTSIASATDGRSVNSYSIKVARATPLVEGQAVKVLHCRQEPDLAGRVLLVDSVSRNGMALLRKGTAIDFISVNQEGKRVL